MYCFKAVLRLFWSIGSVLLLLVLMVLIQVLMMLRVLLVRRWM
jgi:hypothetical protein